MTAANTIFVIACAAAFTEVTPWIVDVGVVGKLLTEDQSESSSVASENDNEVMYTTNYADDFDYYQTFRQKEVKDIIQNGSVYLEGLSDAIAAYRDVLYNCSRYNSSQAGVKDPNAEEITTCEEAEKKKHDVQKLSETALLATDKLRDRAYGEIKQSEDDDERDLIELARSLERLARLTGYDAALKRNPGDTGSTTTVDVAVTDDQPVTAKAATVAATEDSEQQQLEILEQVESRLSRLLPTRLTDVKHKRDTGDVVRYYLKHKIWDGSNPADRRNKRKDRVWNGDQQTEEFDARNSLEVLPIRKRSLDDKKSANMLDVLQNMQKLRCKLREQTKTSARKLVKSIKVYRRKIFTNKSVNGHGH